MSDERIPKVSVAHAHPSFGDPSIGIAQKIHWLVGSYLEAELETNDPTRAAFYDAQAAGRKAALIEYVERLERTEALARTLVESPVIQALGRLLESVHPTPASRSASPQ